ncbi:MAG: ADP-ribosylglycohydrolase family protein [Acidimicrobiia bacterium]
MTSPALLDRAAGVLLGLAAGDALGAGYEFAAPPTAEPAMIGGGLGPWEPGEWTDDTQLALCIAIEAATGDLDPEAVGDRFIRWLSDGASDVGIQTRSVLSAARHGSELVALTRAHFERHPRHSAGNGSLMRTAPVALAYLGDDARIAEAAREISSLTHADSLTGDACVLWCIGIDRAVREARLDGIRDGLVLLDTQARSRWASWLDEAECGPPAAFRENGFVVTVLQAAYAAISCTLIPHRDPCRHLERALHAAVNIGHDTDTVAAIAGSLLGARWGASAIPLRWRRMLHGWPGLTARDLVRLAVLTVRRGRPDSIGWPATSDLLPYYASEYPVPPIAASLPADDGVVLANAAGIHATAAEVVISLCRMGATPLDAGEHHDVWLVDSPDPADNPNLAFVLADTADAIADARRRDQRVLLHCVRAESRTPAVAAAYLIRHHGRSPDEALAQVRQVLPTAEPNAAFRAALDLLAT